ncbi:MAG: hypothetical protein ACJ73S_20935 [Mycobacteriales bacterium]
MRTFGYAMRYARPAVLLAGGWASFALALIGGRESDVMAVHITVLALVMLVLPVLVAVLLAPAGRGFRGYAAAAAVVAAGSGLAIAANVKFGFPRFLLVLAVTFAVAAALPAPRTGRPPAWIGPAALLAGTAVVYAAIAPTLAWREFPDSLRVCVRSPAEAARLAAGDADTLRLGRGVEGFGTAPKAPNCLDVSYESGTPQARVDRVYGRLRHNPAVLSVHKG